jgi:hypothetical protein
MDPTQDQLDALNARLDAFITRADTALTRFHTRLDDLDHDTSRALTDLHNDIDTIRRSIDAIDHL